MSAPHSRLRGLIRDLTNGLAQQMYLWERDGGWIELHGFCARWRPHDSETEGMLNIRRCHRIFIASRQMTPGRYDMSRLRGGTV